VRLAHREVGGRELHADRAALATGAAQFDPRRAAELRRQEEAIGNLHAHALRRARHGGRDAAATCPFEEDPAAAQGIVRQVEGAEHAAPERERAGLRELVVDAEAIGHRGEGGGHGQRRDAVTFGHAQPDNAPIAGGLIGDIGLRLGEIDPVVAPRAQPGLHGRLAGHTHLEPGTRACGEGGIAERYLRNGAGPASETDESGQARDQGSHVDHPPESGTLVRSRTAGSPPIAAPWGIREESRFAQPIIQSADGRRWVCP